MYLIYIDESGVIHGGKREGKFFILSAIVVDDLHWGGIDADVTKAKQKHFPDEPDTLEIHMYDIWQSKKRYTGITIEERNAFLTDIFNIFKTHELTVISTVIKKSESKSRCNSEHLEKMVWGNMVEQIERFLASKEKHSNGIMIVDSKSRHEDARINGHIKMTKRDDDNRTFTSHLIEDVFFTRSDTRNLIQLADVSAFCIRQHLYEHPNIENYWKILASKLWCNDSEACGDFGLNLIS